MIAMTLMLAPTTVDLQHFLIWSLITLGVATVLYGIAAGVNFLEDLALLRAEETPEPVPVKVVQFPTRRMR